MGDALAEVIPIAFGLAMVNPLPIMAVILLLFSARAGVVVPAFLVGWFGGLLLVGWLLIFVVPTERLVGTERDPSTLASVVRIVLGVGLLWLAARKWMTRPKEGETPKLPGWVTSLESAGPLSALGIGAAGVVMEAAATAFELAFTPLEEHRVELWVAEEWMPLPAVTTLLNVLHGRALPAQLHLLPGYDQTNLGTQIG